MMLEVMFVEKRKTLIRTYKQMLAWETYGFKILSATDNEQQAISYYGEYRHDLIFLDLDLKQGDGFSLIRKLKALNQNCMIIVLTHHEDYRSLHDAFRLGVYEYLLKKDIRVALLAEVLQDVKRYYEAHSNHNSWRKRLEHLLGQYRDNDEIERKELYDIFDHELFSLMNQDYRMIYFRMDNVRQINRKLKIYDQPDWISKEDYLKLYAACLKQREVLQEQLEEVIQECMETQPYLLMFIKKHSGVILVSEDKRLAMQELVEHLRNRVIQKCHSDFTFTISSSLCGKEAFLPSLSTVMKKNKDRFYSGDGCILWTHDQEAYQHLEEEGGHFQQRILRELQAFDGDSCLKIAHGMLRLMKLNHIHPDEVIHYILELFIKMEDYLKPKGFHDLTMQKEAVYECETFAFLVFEVDRIFKTLRDELQSYTSKSQRKVERILDYIDAHLQEKLDVEKIAKQAGDALSGTYASKLIKQKTGLSMLQLLLKKRMEMAAELLLETNWKVKEIAERVGYTDQLYFNKAFRRYFGVSPGAYRTRHM